MPPEPARHARVTLHAACPSRVCVCTYSKRPPCAHPRRVRVPSRVRCAQSVANTLKRALLIWLSILYFGNPVTWLSALGTAVCIGGVFAYNHARRVYPYKLPLLLPVESAKERPDR